MGRRKDKHAIFVRALDLWRPPDGAGEPLVCLATTFTFDAPFFETECLGRFLQMDTHPTESEPAAYLVEREEKLASTRTAVFVDRQHADEKESLRWDVLPLRPRMGALHSKLSLLVWANAARVIVGSGNLTTHGYRENLEVFGTLDINKSDAGRVDLFLKATRFLRQLADLAFGDAADPGPKGRAVEALARVEGRIGGWPRSTPSEKVDLVFGSREDSVIQQLAGLWPSNSPARRCDVSSPFFDIAPKDTEVAGAIGGLLAKRGDRECNLLVPSEALPGGSVVVRVSRSFVEALRDGGADVSVLKVDPRQRGTDEDESEVRPLHAKQYWFENKDWVMTMVGSSNCTGAGLGVGAARNIEANLVYRIRTNKPEASALQDTWPAFDDNAVDLDDPSIRWEPAFDESAADEGTMLPGGFEEALFKASEPRELHLRLGPRLPVEWAVRSVDGDMVLDGTSRRSQTREVIIAWAKRSTPVVLNVSWRKEAGASECAASWVVNVIDPSALPPPEVLRELTLEELVEVLGSSRPVYESITRLLARKKRAPSDVELDPLKRVNTDEFLLRRARRVALALDRLRERLERPVLSAEALAWRLCGPVGPVSLAEALLKEARIPGEVPFFLAEVVLMLRRVRPAMPARGGLDEEVIKIELAKVIDDLVARARAYLGHGTPAAMAEYVHAALEVPAV